MKETDRTQQRKLQGTDKRGRAENERLHEEKQRKDYYCIHCMRHFLHTITAQHCRGINTV